MPEERRSGQTAGAARVQQSAGPGEAHALNTALGLATRAAAATAMTVGGLVLLGWALDISQVKTLLPGAVAMKVNAAISFGLCGLSLWLQRDEGAPKGRRRVARSCAALVVLLGALTLSEYALEKDFGIDQMLFVEGPGAADTAHPGRMGPVTCLSFVFIGLALIGLDWRLTGGARPAQALVLPPAGFGFLALAGYLYGARSFYALPDLTAMALHTAFLFGILSLGLLCARPDAGAINVLVGSGPGSIMARRLLPLSVGLPILIGGAGLAAGRAGWFDPQTGVALQATANILVFANLLWLTGVWLNRADARRRQAEAEIRALNAALERRVQARTAEMRAKAAQLESANAELEAFAYSVSHDLRSPLRAIDGFSQALAEDYERNFDAAGRDYLERIRAAAQRMGHLIDDLLNLSRVNRTEMDLESVDLTAVARECIHRLQADEAHRTVQWEVEESLLATGDERLLKIALENLLGNALKFTGRRAEARIEFKRERTDAGDTFFVRDNGAGFDMVNATHLFGAFQRLHTAQEFPGSGIGLATVQRVIHRHGGRVWAEASPGKGATFYFTLSALPELAQ